MYPFLIQRSTMVRFHPTRKFVLASGCFDGGITIMDIQSTKKLFADKNAHGTQPVRDISMFDSSNDLFVSCGFDCNINIFDLRIRSVVQQHKQPHPMSTVCVSSCGTYCVAGNLKGDVVSYDFRNMKEPLFTKRLHDSAVVRVAFVPSVATTLNATLNQTVNNTGMETSGLSASSTPQASGGGESFAKFVDVCHYNNLAAADSATPKRRDSWSDLMPARKIHDFSMDSMITTPQRMSSGFENRSELRLKRPARTSLDQSVVSICSSFASPQNSTGIEIKVTDSYQQPNSKDVKSIQLGSQFNNLQNIREESLDTAAKSSQLEAKKPLGESNGDVAGRKRRSTLFDAFSMELKSKMNSFFSCLYNMIE